MQNGGMLLAATTLFFRAHTRVLTTLTVALAVTCLCLASSAHHAAPAPLCAANKIAPRAALPIRSTPTQLPRTFLRLFFILPHLLPTNNN